MNLSEQTQLIVPPARPVLAFSPHALQPALDRELVHAVLLPDETIVQYLVRSGIAARMDNRPFVLEINGLRVPRSLWHCTRPKPGTLINLYAIVRGGGGGGKKNPIATIAMIVIMVVASYYLGPAGAGLSGWQYTAGLATVSVAGGLIVNPLFPPPKPKISELEGIAAGLAVVSQ